MAFIITSVAQIILALTSGSFCKLASTRSYTTLVVFARFLTFWCNKLLQCNTFPMSELESVISPRSELAFLSFSSLSSFLLFLPFLGSGI